ncbi:hypothetical protein GCM10007209_35770 [Haloferax sulfurifontis]|uniref:Uncharacterized protein n=1 Tax=Haloferax sulfurifontis TaxID=255616 RepID=A0A830DXY4_9EURY|nr:hypothetical protein GCM10007209_35770 [Haloferax sulfurifontis]
MDARSRDCFNRSSGQQIRLLSRPETPACLVTQAVWEVERTDESPDFVQAMRESTFTTRLVPTPTVLGAKSGELLSSFARDRCPVRVDVSADIGREAVVVSGRRSWCTYSLALLALERPPFGTVVDAVPVDDEPTRLAPSLTSVRNDLAATLRTGGGSTGFPARFVELSLVDISCRHLEHRATQFGAPRTRQGPKNTVAVSNKQASLGGSLND